MEMQGSVHAGVAEQDMHARLQPAPAMLVFHLLAWLSARPNAE
jgi:hypothetical protein